MQEILLLELRKMISWSLYIYVFFLAHVKFLFAASIAEVTTNLNFTEILVSSTLGAVFCFNAFFFISKSIFHSNSTSIWVSYFKQKKRNRIIVKIKNSNGGFLLLCTLAPLLLTIPIGTFIVVKFYGKRRFTYFYVTALLVFTSSLLTYLNHFIFH